MRKSISLFLSVVMLFIPLIVNAQETISEEKAKAVEQVEADAESDVDTASCFVISTINVVVVIIAVKKVSPCLSDFEGFTIFPSCGFGK